MLAPLLVQGKAQHDPVLVAARFQAVELFVGAGHDDTTLRLQLGSAVIEQGDSDSRGEDNEQKLLYNLDADSAGNLLDVELSTTMNPVSDCYLTAC